MSDPLIHLGSIWYPSESSDIPYSPNQFLGWDVFAASYSKMALSTPSKKFDITGAPVAFKTWRGHHYMVGIICPPG